MEIFLILPRYDPRIGRLYFTSILFATHYVGPQYRCGWSKFVPQLSRTSLQTEHFKHNMQGTHMRLVVRNFMRISR